ncbi:MAG: GH74, partial [uncultured Thermomicrobiales bacterium]
HPQGRLHPHRRRHARAVVGERPPLRRVGAVPPQGVAGGARPDLGVADERVVRAAAAAVGRRRPHVGAGGQRVRLRRRAGHAPVVRRLAAPVGVQARVAHRAVAHRPRHRVRGRRGRRALPLHRRRAELVGALGTPPPQHGGGVGARRRRDVPPHHPPRPARRAADVRRDLGGRRVPHRRRRHELAPDHPGPHLQLPPRPHGRGGALRAPHRDAPRAARRALHAEALGRDAQRRRRRLVARGERRPPVRLRLRRRRARARAGDGLRRAHHERLAALPARGEAARLPQPHGGRRVGAAHARAAAAGLLRQRAARRDGGGRARPVRRLLRHDGRPGVRLARRRRRLGGDRARPPRRALGGGADAPM